jgi:fructosamine-3-kinase
MWHSIEQAISAALDEPYTITEKQVIQNGASSGSLIDKRIENDSKFYNLSFRVTNGRRSYFVKLNRKKYLKHFQAEAFSLQHLKSLNNIACPNVTTIGTSLDKSFLVLEYLDFSRAKPMLWHQLGQQLAQMHYDSRHDQFGWQHDNYIGDTIQPNHWSNNWSTFFANQRIAWQLQLLSERSIMLGNIDHITQVCHDTLLHYRAYPCLVHGDLWQGNTGFTGDQAVIFDPACYYGDREVDIAMTELFSEFPDDFYHGYQAEYPLDKGYEQRKLVYNFYHILNHANIFGGIYIDQAKAILSRIMSLALH